MNRRQQVTIVRLREALEASWDTQTAYMEVYEEGNPALGQCYPTSRVVRSFFTDTEIVEGGAWTGHGQSRGAVCCFNGSKSI